MTDLPPISDIQSSTSLATALTVLFEASPSIVSKLEPAVAAALATAPPLASYSQLIDTALTTIATWDTSSQAQFIAGHPRIGETKNLSKLSAKEQGAVPGGVAPTPPEVLARLSHLNECYETVYPGLRYITFVNGRSRAVIAEEMEDVLGLEHSLVSDEPAINTLNTMEVDGSVWRSELKRAIRDIGLIAKHRLGAIGVV